MAAGRDASDVAMTTSFGMANLTQFTVVSEEIAPQNARLRLRVPLFSAESR